MKPIMKIAVCLILLGGLVFNSCKKERTCQTCGVNPPPPPQGGINKPPIANAGPDQIITLPVDSVSLNGTASLDPDGTISSFQWTKIWGPATYSITNPSASITTSRNLLSGVYWFELKITDNDGLAAKDTVQVTVNPSAIITACSSRPLVQATLVPMGFLSTARAGLATASAGSKILFAGGWEPGAHSTRVDIYDTITRIWSTAELSEALRDGMVAASVGSKIFFAGGGDNDWFDMTSRIDIYDASTNSWSTAELSEPRKYLAAATAGNKVFFAGGGNWGNMLTGSSAVDIYDNSTNTWTKANLSVGRYELTATAAGNKIYFAGGLENMYVGSNRIDIYDLATNTWSTSLLHEVKASPGSIAVNNKIFWAAGANTPYQSGYHYSNQVEIRDLTTGVSTFDCITPKAQFQTVIKGDNIVFFTTWQADPNNNKFDIYNTTTNTWSVGMLPVNINGAAIISVNNTIYVAGGRINGGYTNEVWKLEF